METKDIISGLAKQALTPEQTAKLANVVAMNKAPRPAGDTDRDIEAISRHRLTEQQVAELEAVVAANNTAVLPEDERAYVQAYHEALRLYPRLTRHASMAYTVVVEADIVPYKSFLESLSETSCFGPDFLIKSQNHSVRCTALGGQAGEKSAARLAEIIRRHARDSIFEDQNARDLHAAVAALAGIVKKYPKDFLIARLRKNHFCLQA